MKQSNKTEWAIWGVCALSFAVTLALLPLLPARIPVHWNVDGQIDGWAARPGAFFGPAMGLGLSLLMKFLPYMDGTLFSYVYKMAKPDREIYEKLCTMYQLNPRETVFFDDREDNIAGAGACGIHGILFQNHEQAKKDLETLLKRENGK